MGLIKEFKDFALKGNVMDLAVGVIIGGAFGGIVNSAVNDLIMPLIGIFGNADFHNLYFGLQQGVRDAVAANPALTLEEARKIGPVFAYGSFITVAVNFLILAFIIFMMIRLMTGLRKKEAAAPAAPAEPSTTEKLLTEIRDSLKK